MKVGESYMLQGTLGTYTVQCEEISEDDWVLLSWPSGAQRWLPRVQVERMIVAINAA